MRPSSAAGRRRLSAVASDLEAAHRRRRLATEIAKVAEGDHAAFVRVYEATSAKLYGLIVRYLGRTHLADEILQETYVRLWTRAGSFDPAVASPITWLASIARNLALDAIRRRPAESLDALLEIRDFPSEHDLAGDLASRDELRKLDAALLRLAPDERALIEAIYFTAASCKALGLKLGLPVSNVRRRLRAALVKLKAHLEGRAVAS